MGVFALEYLLFTLFSNHISKIDAVKWKVSGGIPAKLRSLSFAKTTHAWSYVARRSNNEKAGYCMFRVQIIIHNVLVPFMIAPRTKT